MMTAALASEADLAAPAAHPTACFSLHAAADPGLLPRVMEQFAKRGLVPSGLYGRLEPDGVMAIDVQMPGMAPAIADHVARVLRTLPGVEVVMTSPRHEGTS